jgi:DNA-binding Lrp family transcriptional regulator
MTKLDRIDFDIISALRNNARISNKLLAEKIGLAASSCLERVRYLRQQGFLKQAHTEIDLSVLGLDLQAMVSVRLHQRSRSDFEEFRNYLSNLPNVQTIYHLSGENDFLVHVATESTSSLREYILDTFSERPEVAHIETSLIFEAVRNWSIPEQLMDKIDLN